MAECCLGKPVRQATSLCISRPVENCIGRSPSLNEIVNVQKKDYLRRMFFPHVINLPQLYAFFVL